MNSRDLRLPSPIYPKRPHRLYVTPPQPVRLRGQSFSLIHMSCEAVNWEDTRFTADCCCHRTAMERLSLPPRPGASGAHSKQPQDHLDSAPGPETAQHKRRREHVVGDEFESHDGDEMPFGYKRRKHCNPDKTVQSDPIEGPSIISAAAASPSISLPPAAEPVYNLAQQAKATVRSKSLDDCEPAAFSSLRDMLKRSQAKIVRLEAELLESRQYGTQVEMRVKQDMLLDIFKEQERRQKVEYQLAREQRHVSKLAEHYLENTKKLETAQLLERKKCLLAQQEAKTWRGEVDHLQTLTAMLETDMDELRQIENAAAARKRDEDSGLPPAYGTLDDEDRFPPYGRYTDGGILEVATIKRLARVEFQRRADAAQTRAVVLRNGNIIDQALGGSEVLRSITQGLADTCHGFQILLDRAPQILVTRRQAATASTRAGSGSSIKAFTQQPASAPFFADRLAKLTIDLGWRTISTLELRPSTPTLTPYHKATLALQHAKIDDALLNMLQASFGERRILADLQYYLTQLISLRERFIGIRMGISYTFFHKCAAWLGDQVEKERELAASRADAERVRAESLDDVSSQWPGSESADGAVD